jgi:cytochrome c oxidase subunit 4
MSSTPASSSTSSPIHVSSVGTYLAVFGALMVLTASTVWVAYFDLGVLNDVAAMGIAATKGTLVILFFMHVRYSTKLTKLTVMAGFVWLFILFLLTFSDYMTRGVFGVAGK